MTAADRSTGQQQAGQRSAGQRSAGHRPGDGTPEQVHLTWGADPSRSVTISWASPERSREARAILRIPGAGERSIPAIERAYTDGINGETVWAYHAPVTGLEPGRDYRYTVTSGNDRMAADPFTASFRTAPAGRAPFRFTSFGDLATPNTKWGRSYGQSAYAVDQIAARRPLFHLLNGDLCYSNLHPTTQPEVWRDFGRNNQRAAAFLPWMPCPGNHELEFYNGPQGLTSYLTRYALPDNGVPGFRGRWYAFRIGAVLFVSLDADDVIYQDSAAFVAGPGALTPAAGTGNPPILAGTSLYVRGYSDGRQTAWLDRTLAAGRADDSLDWIIVQMHQCALSSSRTGNGSDLGIREAWLGLFDQYQVDLVLCGHDHDYERSFPVRGADRGVGWDAATGAPVDTYRPRPVTTLDSGTFDTSQGTVHLVLGGGGSNAPLNEYGFDGADGRREARLFTRRNAPTPTGTPGAYTRAGADAREHAVWSAKRDLGPGYGIALFDVDPAGVVDDSTTIRVTYLHAPSADRTNPHAGARRGPNPSYEVFETFTLVRPHRGGSGRDGSGGGRPRGAASGPP